MVDETTTEQLAEIEGQGELITGPGLYQARCGDLVQITRWRAGWWVSEWKGIRTDYHSDGRKRLRTEADAGRWDLLHWVAPLPASEPEPETTTEQLAEIEGQATAYTPPEGWRVLVVGEVLREGDVIVHTDDATYATARAGKVVQANQRYIRPIEPQPEAEPVQVREGRWRTRSGEVKNIRPCEPLKGAYYVWPWTDGFMTFQDNGLHQGSKESPNDLVEYLGPIEQQPEPVPAVQGGLVRDVTHLLEESGVLDSAKAEQQIEELRSEVSYVQRLLGESRQRVTQLEDLVGSLRTINEAQEKAFTAAGKANDDLQHRLNVVAAEWAEQAETSRRLQIELDAAQQVPQAIADRFEEGWNQGTARAVETVLEWLEPIRAVDNEHLANEVLQHLPQIMRHLTGLTQD